MAVESDTDRAAFFDTDEFGVAASVTIDGGGAETVNGVFDNEYVGVLDGEASTPVESTRPVFTVATDDVTGIGHGDSVVISGTTYTVRGVEPDGTGVTRLVMEAA